MRILLVLPFDATYRRRGAFSRSISYAPLTLTSLAALVPEDIEAEISLVDEGVQAPVSGDEDVDIVGITCVTSSAPRAYELCRRFRKRGIVTVLGGVHVTLNPSDAAPHADVVVTGPAEVPWPQVIRDVHAGRAPAALYHGGSPAKVAPVVPARHLLGNSGYLKIPTLIAARGCTNRCTYCSVHRVWDGCACRRPVGEVVDELSRLPGRHALFLDPNLTNDRQYALSLFEAMSRSRRKWAGLATVDISEDHELLLAAARSGCIGLLIGFESTTQATLQGCNKATNHVRKYKEAVRTLHRLGIRVLGCFVLGFDEDTLESVSRTAEISDELGIDIPRYAVLTPFPGTPLFTELKSQGRILTEDWVRYDTENVVFQPKQMTPAQLQFALREAWQRSYQLGRIARRTMANPHQILLAAAASWGFRRYARGLSHRAATVPHTDNGSTYAAAG